MCAGKLTLNVKVQGKDEHRRPKATIIGMVTFSIRAGKTATVKLNSAGRALLKVDHGRPSATLTILKSSPAPSQIGPESVQLVRVNAAKARNATK